jgi:DNA-binding transcriptional LysR family regulator
VGVIFHCEHHGRVRDAHVCAVNPPRRGPRPRTVCEDSAVVRHGGGRRSYAWTELRLRDGGLAWIGGGGELASGGGRSGVRRATVASAMAETET